MQLQHAKHSSPATAASIIDELCSHRPSGAHGFYDDLGELGNQPHLVLKADPTSQGDCRGLANYTIVTISPSSQYYDIPDKKSVGAEKLVHEQSAPWGSL